MLISNECCWTVRIFVVLSMYRLYRMRASEVEFKTSIFVVGFVQTLGRRFRLTSDCYDFYNSYVGRLRITKAMITAYL